MWRNLLSSRNPPRQRMPNRKNIIHLCINKLLSRDRPPIILQWSKWIPSCANTLKIHVSIRDSVEEPQKRARRGVGFADGAEGSPPRLKLRFARRRPLLATLRAPAPHATPKRRPPTRKEVGTKETASHRLTTLCRRHLARRGRTCYRTARAPRATPTVCASACTGRGSTMRLGGTPSPM